MEGLTIMESARLDKIENNMSGMYSLFNNLFNELKEARKPYLSEAEALELTGMSRTTLWKYRETIGFSRPAGIIRYKRKDLLDFMNQSYYKKN